ncbi:MAG: hypothetical protein OK442_05500 [Thaumarchaeota archaeon]|nr:hypothetical protein [Nitrososphaerota archaeon]
MFLHTDRGTMDPIASHSLEKSFPKIRNKLPAILGVSYPQVNMLAYHSYLGGVHWIVRVPRIIARPHEEFSSVVCVPSGADFVRNLQTSTPLNVARSPWRADSTRIEYVKTEGDLIRIGLSQRPRLEGISNFEFSGKSPMQLHFVNGVVDLKFDITDVFGSTRTIAIYHNGYSPAVLGIKAGKQLYHLHHVSFDGFRTNFTFRYRRSNMNTVTLYLRSPAELYKIGGLVEKPNLAMRGSARTFRVESIEISRSYEKRMIAGGRKYQIGRVGAEIALAIAAKLGLKDVILRDPSLGGKDLYSKDLSSIIQARMLTSTQYASGEDGRTEQILLQLARLIRKLKVDFGYNPLARSGYAVLSYLDNSRKILAIVIEVRRH